MKTNNNLYKQLIVMLLSGVGVYLFTTGEFIISSVLLCGAFVVTNLVSSGSLRT